MNLWHASTELHTTADAVVAKTVYLAAGLETGYALDLGLELTAQVEAQMAPSGLSGKSDTSG